MGSAGDESFSGFFVDSAGNVYVTGSTTGDLWGSNNGSEEVLAAKYSSTGTLLWVKQFDIDGNATSAVVNSSGDIYLVAGSSDYHSPSVNAWVAKLAQSNTAPALATNTG